MSDEVRFAWQVIYRAKRSLIDPKAGRPFFNVREMPAYANSISAKRPSLYHPLRIEPTNLFHNLARKQLQKEYGIDIKEKNFPYRMKVRGFAQPLSVGIIGHLFLPDLILFRVVTHGYQVLDRSAAFRQRQFADRPELKHLSNLAAGLLEGEAPRDAGKKNFLQARPIISILQRAKTGQGPSDIEPFIVALLINDVKYKSSSDQIRNSVLQKNRDHNRKGENSRTIIADKQGLLIWSTSQWENETILGAEVKKKSNMFELAMALQQFYETYPSQRIHDPSALDYLFYATKPYIVNPAMTFDDSYTNTVFWALLNREFKLSESFSDARRFDVDSPNQIAKLFDASPNPGYSDPAFWRQIEIVMGADYARDVRAGHNFTVSSAGVVHVGDNYSQNTINAGAVGSGAKADTVTFNNVTQSQNIGVLVPELQRLAAAMRREAASPDEEVASENVESAAKAAIDGKPNHVTAYLKRGGTLALEFAEKIGADLAVSAIKNSLGMPG